MQTTKQSSLDSMRPAVRVFWLRVTQPNRFLNEAKKFFTFARARIYQTTPLATRVEVLASFDVASNTSAVMVRPFSHEELAINPTRGT